MKHLFNAFLFIQIAYREETNKISNFMMGHKLFDERHFIEIRIMNNHQ